MRSRLLPRKAIGQVWNYKQMGSRPSLFPASLSSALPWRSSYEPPPWDPPHACTEPQLLLLPVDPQTAKLPPLAARLKHARMAKKQGVPDPGDEDRHGTGS